MKLVHSISLTDQLRLFDAETNRDLADYMSPLIELLLSSKVIVTGERVFVKPDTLIHITFTDSMGLTPPHYKVLPRLKQIFAKFLVTSPCRDGILRYKFVPTVVDYEIDIIAIYTSLTLSFDISVIDTLTSTKCSVSSFDPQYFSR